MRKLIILVLAAITISCVIGLVACSTPVSDSKAIDSRVNADIEEVSDNLNLDVADTGIDTAIEEVKNSLTSDVSGSFEAVKYENGYVVNFDDMAYWYVEDGTVWSLNGFAKTYAQNTEYKYGIEWEDLF